MQLELISTNQTLFSGEIYLIQVPGSKGSFEVLNNHVPIVSSLESGKIKIITNSGEERFFNIKDGFIEVKNNVVNVLVTT
ncbi:MAG: ATP synthase F1 subunit epsilon [Bacteroidales bacterium]|nr:ATP synthase F1 subunit epsilon [Bacteroidales bacterium]